MAKRRLTEESFHDFRDRKRVTTSPAVGKSHGFNGFCFSGGDDDVNEQERSESSVGSNDPIREVLVLADNDGDEVESPTSKIDTCIQEDITGDELEDTKTRFTLYKSPEAFEKQCVEIELTDKKRNEEEEEEYGNWWVEFGSMIVDNNGFLLGEYRRLDEELYINIATDE